MDILTKTAAAVKGIGAGTGGAGRGQKTLECDLGIV
jgi:hypothetical protein